MRRQMVTVGLVLAIIMMIVPTSIWGHCEIPCGIYGDQTRINLLEEHITTIAKSMKRINTLSADTDINYNQLVRWVDNKETHAEKFMEIVTQYFMTQRIKPADEASDEKYAKYVSEVTLCHQMLVSAMKCKQTTDVANTEKLTELLEKFKTSYMGKK